MGKVEGEPEPVKRPAEYYRVTLRAEGPGPPAIHRLRSWLKTALRQHGLRAVRVEEVQPPGPPAAGEGAAGRAG